jgi:hypothetical protein
MKLIMKFYAYIMFHLSFYSLTRLINTRVSAAFILIKQQRNNFKAAQFSSLSGLKYRIRPAFREDIPAIAKCNVANLPENYPYAFYVNHLSRWSDLSFIAETESNEVVIKSFTFHSYSFNIIEFLFQIDWIYIRKS